MNPSFSSAPRSDLAETGLAETLLNNLPGLAPPPISDSDFVLFQRLIEKEAGIYLAPVKKALLVGRLTRRLRDLSLDSFNAYYKRVMADPAEMICMIDRVSTNETQFFREPPHFEFLETRVFPQWLEQAAAGERPRRIRVWSAACSSGEEAYSLAMTLLHHFPAAAGWQIEILATDISTRVLDRGRAGIWPVEKSAQIPAPYLKEFMLRGTGGQAGRMKAGPDLRRVVRFERFNLLEEDTYPRSQTFDLVFCRNVLIYFKAETKTQVIRRLLNYVAPDGYFFVGHSESLNYLSDCARSVIPTVYMRPGLSSKSVTARPTEALHG